MKNTLKFAATLLVVSFLSINSFAQSPPPPNGGIGAPSGGNTAVGGGSAPIGTGLLLLLGLTGAYVGKKVFDFKNQKMEE